MTREVFIDINWLSPMTCPRVAELEPSFPYRDVSIRRAVDMKELYDLQSELGR
jgi:hypothetical protein